MARHILLIVIDQFRADCVTGALAEACPLPNIAALRSEAVTFTNHYTVTTPCGPSRASLLTGLYAMNHRSVRNGTPLSSRHKTIGTLLRSAGFDSMLFGYTDTSVDPATVHPNDPRLRNYEGVAAGFSEMVSMRYEAPGAWTGYLKNKGYAAPANYWDWYRPVLDKSTATEQDRAGSPIRSPARYSSEDSDTAFLANRTMEAWSGLSEQDRFSLVTFIRPHPPLVAPSPYNLLIDPAAVPRPRQNPSMNALADSHPFYSACFSNLSSRGLYVGFDGDTRSISERHVAELRAVYLGLAAEVDHHIGRLIDWLKLNDQYDSTLIVLTADHGEMLGDHYLWGKLAPFEPALHIPLVIRDPSQPQMHGNQVSAFTESIDIAPTLMDWADGKSVPAFNGYSLLPWVRGQSPTPWRKHVFAEAELGEPDVPSHYQRHTKLAAEQANFCMYREERYKYVHFNGQIAPMLFDLQADPDEYRCLADSPVHNALKYRQMTHLLNHRMSYAEHSLSKMKITPGGLFS